MATKWYVNTDTVDIANRQIGIHSSRDKREFCVGVNHLGTKESVSNATKVALRVAIALNTKTYTGEQVLELLESVLTGPCAARCMDDETDRRAVLREMRNALKSSK